MGLIFVVIVFYLVTESCGNVVDLWFLFLTELLVTVIQLCHLVLPVVDLIGQVNSFCTVIVQNVTFLVFNLVLLFIFRELEGDALKTFLNLNFMVHSEKEVNRTKNIDFLIVDMAEDLLLH